MARFLSKIYLYVDRHLESSDMVRGKSRALARHPPIRCDQAPTLRGRPAAPDTRALWTHRAFEPIFKIQISVPRSAKITRQSPTRNDHNILVV